MARSAIYAGSFDPITVGHVDLIERGSVLFDRLLVAVGNNAAKRYFFDLEARERLVREACSAFENVEVISFDGLLVHAAEEHDAQVLLRGLRAISDFEMEFRNGLANRDLSGIETVFLLTDPENIFVSSSLVKEIAMAGGDVSSYVPAPVLAALNARLAGR